MMGLSSGDDPVSVCYFGDQVNYRLGLSTDVKRDIRILSGVIDLREYSMLCNSSRCLNKLLDCDSKIYNHTWGINNLLLI
jgi:hypothetical protein